MENVHDHYIVMASDGGVPVSIEALHSLEDAFKALMGEIAPEPPEFLNYRSNEGIDNEEPPETLSWYWLRDHNITYVDNGDSLEWRVLVG